MQVFFSSFWHPPGYGPENNKTHCPGPADAGVGLTGALIAVSGGISVGNLTSFLNYANQYTKPFNEISGVVTELQNALACAGRVLN